MAKKKGQSLDFKTDKTPREFLRRAIWGRNAEGPEMHWALVLAWAADDPAWKKMAREIFVQLCEAAQRGDDEVFRRLADCVAHRKEFGEKKWVDQLSCDIIEYARGMHGGIFNVEQFIEERGRKEDRKTITARVRAMKFRYQVGRPTGRKNLPH